MNQGAHPKYYIVLASMLPEVFLKVSEAKELLETGEVHTVAEAAQSVGISRSAYYKYRDAITPFLDLKQGNILSFNILLRNKTGVLSSVLSIFAGSGSNILTINQSIPINGRASVTITAESNGMSGELEALLERLRAGEGVIKAEVLASE